MSTSVPTHMGEIPGEVKEAAHSLAEKYDPQRHLPEEQRHKEGPIATQIEEYTARIPSDTFLWAAGASILGSLSLKLMGKRSNALFVGQWAAPFMLLGIYNKMVKQHGTDRAGTKHEI